MYAAGILRVHDASEMRAASQNSERSRNRSQKIAAPLPTKRHRQLPFDIGKTAVLPHSHLRLCIFCEALCSNVGTIVLYVGTIVLCQLRRCKASAPSRLAKAFQFFKGQAPRAGCHLLRNTGKERDKRKGTKKKW